MRVRADTLRMVAQVVRRRLAPIRTLPHQSAPLRTDFGKIISAN